MNADCICLTETWLNADDKAEQPHIPEFVFKHNPRAKCYDNSTALFAELKHQRGGGVGMYCSEYHIFTPEHWNLECLYFIVHHVNLTAALLYRPSSYKIEMRGRHDMMRRLPKGGKVLEAGLAGTGGDWHSFHF